MKSLMRLGAPAALMLVVVLGACSKDSTAVDDILGIYNLVSTDGHALPYAEPGHQYADTLLSGTLKLESGTFTLEAQSKDVWQDCLNTPSPPNYTCNLGPIKTAPYYERMTGTWTGTGNDLALIGKRFESNEGGELEVETDSVRFTGKRDGKRMTLQAKFDENDGFLLVFER